MEIEWYFRHEMMTKTENGKEVMGSWHVDGFCLDGIVTPIYEKGYKGCTRWKQVKRCGSQEEAEQECAKHNKSIGI